MNKQLAEKFKNVVDEIKTDLKEKNVDAYEIKNWLDLYYKKNTRDISIFSPEVETIFRVLGMLFSFFIVLYTFGFIISGLYILIGSS